MCVCGYIYIYIYIILNCFRFEAFNSVIRTLNVHSNRHGSSKDIGERLVQHHVLKFLINGGRWGTDNRLFI